MTTKKHLGINSSWQQDLTKFVTTLDPLLLPQNLLDSIIPAGKLAQAQALQVYQNDYKARMFEALGANYEATWLYLGDEIFQKLCFEYIKLTPSHYKSLNDYGESFPDFILKNENIFLDKAHFQNTHTLSLFEKSFWKLFHQKGNNSQKIEENHFQAQIFELSELYLFQTHFDIINLFENRKLNSLDYEIKFFQEIQNILLWKSEEKVEYVTINYETFMVFKFLKEKKALCELDTSNYDLAIDKIQWPVLFKILMFFNKDFV